MTLDDHREEHPEDLIDRALAGGLAAAERARLDKHLLACGACAAQIAHAGAFEADIAAQPRDSNLNRRAIEAAMGRLVSATRSRRARLGWWRWAAAGVLLTLGSAGAALLVQPASPPVVAPTSAPPSAPASASAVNVVPSSPSADRIEREAVAAQPPASAGAASPTAAVLFERGGELRRRGERDAAVAVYRRLQHLHPAARETRLSFALAGRLLLDAGRPADALAQFDRYLAGGGGVDEEALAGRARALEQVGRSRDAAAAWRRLLERHPQSVYAPDARARLQQLSAPQR